MFVSITRLRLRSWRFMPAFIMQALRAAVQAKAAPGNLGVAILAEANRTYWTRTIWTDEDAMRAFIRSGVHRRVMVRLADWCDEAAVAHWSQATTDVPSWDDTARRLQRDGRPSAVNHPTPAHRNFQIAAPKIGRFGELRLK
jgi:heme-degrading monooxygenase HmoA